jgi:hypothetical protein
MTVVYPVIFTETKDEKETVLVFIPDFNGMTEGYGIADAIGMAKDYIGNRLYDKADAEFPASTPIADVDVSKGEFSESGKPFVSLVDVDMDVFRRKEKSRMVRRNITLPEWLDEMATEAKINVSAVVQEALKERLQTA